LGFINCNGLNEIGCDLLQLSQLALGDLGIVFDIHQELREVVVGLVLVVWVPGIDLFRHVLQELIVTDSQVHRGAHGEIVKLFKDFFVVVVFDDARGETLNNEHNFFGAVKLVLDSSDETVILFAVTTLKWIWNEAVKKRVIWISRSDAAALALLVNYD